MKKNLYSLGLLLALSIPLLAFGQSSIGWPTVEDTCMVPPGASLNTFIFEDTVNHVASWQAGTRVYVLKAGEYYNWAGSCTLKVANRAIRIRGEYGKNYAQPYTGLSDIRPIIQSSTASTTWWCIGATMDTICLKNINIIGYDEITSPTNIDKNNFTLTNIIAAGTGSVFIDSCLIRGPITCFQINARPSLLSGDKSTCRITNSIIGCVGGNFLLTNFGAGRVVDLRGIGIDTLIMENNTIFNVVDRVVRYMASLNPVYSFKFNHNTVFNCMSYHGFVSLGWIDTLGNGPFQIKDNLFVDPYVLGPDTDWTRQGEMGDNPDQEVNGFGKCTWFIARKNNETHITPWEISNNYYYISDSGKAIRDYVTTNHKPYYLSTADEPILTSDISRQLIANGGNSIPFLKAKIQFNKAPSFPSKFARWYFNDAGLGYVPTTLCGPMYGTADSAVGAGAGKLKNTTKPVANFVVLTQYITKEDQFYRWPYSFEWWRLDSLLQYLDCGFQANIDLSTASSDGKVIGDPRWSWAGYLAGSAPTFSPSSTTINFGTVNTNVTKKDSIIVTNNGQADLKITAVVSSNPLFTVTPTGATIIGQASQKFYITFAPTANGTENGKIAFTHNASTHDTITVTGNGNVVAVDSKDALIPDIYQLHDNYPNPFNPSTTIQYDLPRQSKVVLKVYSMLGQEIATLVNGVVEAGYHQTVWQSQHASGRQVASGVYFFRLFAQSTSGKSEEFTQVKKMILIK